MILRMDHVAGGMFVFAGAIVFVVSGDLPFGTLASPGAGMLPKLVIGLMISFGLVLLWRGNESAPFTDIDWSDGGHAIRVLAAAALATALYTTLGFVVTMTLLLFGLSFAVERRNVWRAAAFSIGVTVLAALLFGALLKSPLPRGIMGF
jgi:Tripartite tricarboxylate transporter TctB family